MWSVFEFFFRFLGLIDSPSCFFANSTNHVEYLAGSTNVIISAPHGGWELDPRIAPRQPGCLKNGRCIWNYDCQPKNQTACGVIYLGDKYTMDISLLIVDEYKELTGKRPHLILNRLSRSQMDANRNRKEGTGGDPIAGAVWDDFQGYIKYSKCLVKNGLYLDIHGHKHPEGRVELGYRIDKKSLNSGHFSGRISTIAWAVKNTGLNLITGSYSFGNLLSEMGFPTVPSPRIAKPGDAEYFRGGYNVKKHGSLKRGEIDGIQVEIPKHVRFEPKRRQMFSRVMAEAIDEFMDIRKGEATRRICDEETGKCEKKNSWFGWLGRK